MEVICAILTALFGIGFGIFMALQPEDAIALHDRGRYTQTEPTEAYIKLTRLEGIVAFGALCRASGGAAVRTPIILCSFPLADSFSHPATMRKNAGGILLWSSM